jgi:hypothetical protein
MKSESEVQAEIRLKASEKGIRLWRNNVGCAKTAQGFVRYGLANETAEMNKKIKSADLIGITPHTVTNEDIGKTLGIFTSIEVKREGWKTSGKEHDAGQSLWVKIVQSLGGIAKIVQSSDEI